VIAAAMGRGLALRLRILGNLHRLLVYGAGPSGD
jgi:hypothetical protein